MNTRKIFDRDKIKQLLEERGKTTSDLADKVRTTKRMIDRFLNDGVTPSYELALKIAHAFKLSYEDLLCDTPPLEF